MKQSNKFYKVAGVLALGIVCLFIARVAFADTALDFTLHNKTGKDIYGLYCTAHEDDEWGPDILGKDVLLDGDKLDIAFSKGKQSPSYDLKVVFDNEKSSVWSNLDLSQITDITLSYRDGKPWAKWENK